MTQIMGRLLDNQHGISPSRSAEVTDSNPIHTRFGEVENSEQSKLSKLWERRGNLAVLILIKEPVGLSTNIAEPSDCKNHPAQLFVICSVQDKHRVILAPQDRVKGANLPPPFCR